MLNFMDNQYRIMHTRYRTASLLKIINSLALLSLFGHLVFGQIDMLDEGLQSCLEDNEYKFINDLFRELELYSFERLNVEFRNYEKLTHIFCKNNENNKFLLSESSVLSTLIKEGISKDFWVYEKYEPNDNNLYIIDGDTVEIIPPHHPDYEPLPPESREQCYINPKNKFISCSYDYTFHRALIVFYQKYETFKVAGSIVKLCSMTEFFNEGNYNLSSIKHYILIHSICQRIIHDNGYYKYFQQ